MKPITAYEHLAATHETTTRHIIVWHWVNASLYNGMR
jgi:hypothetical protein